MSPITANLTAPGLFGFRGPNLGDWSLDSVFLVNVVAALWIQYWVVMIDGVRIGEKILSQAPKLQAFVDWLDGGVKDMALAGPCDWFNLKACGSGSGKQPDGVTLMTSKILKSDDRGHDHEHGIEELPVAPLQPRQRAVQAGVVNPVQHGQSFDCHDQGNSSTTGALYGDILPAIEVIDSFPVDSKCMALPSGCFLQSCHGTAGIFLCNKSTENVNIDCSYLAKIAREVFTNYISRHQDQLVRLDFCRRAKPPVDELERPLMDGPKGQEYTGNSFRKREFATQGGDDMWSLQINRTRSCYERQDGPRGFEDGFIELGRWAGLVYRK
ncbi:uncharacterized protein DFL_009897 [Arthrobotrys flagrans]|uniref:Uncharacterized protein n=1 Tax=Arthrobotrys flagrans TaxID=97331 RepID=A0A436ZSX9_ARTFL|nr:hypothetical protein DFL_009897 [Arthrobotrys flagrans]